ncbi:MAG: DNA primase [Lachnospiraceae bacterium]|nr:DNA primase [Lachnospiraceae bacterium]
MYYPPDLVEQVRTSNNIVDVISQYVHLQKKGSTYFGLCPFHNEKTGSFSVSPSKQMFYCFGCGEGGNVLSFLMKYENLTFSEAVKALADRAGITLPEVEMTAEMKHAQQEREALFEINREAAKFYYYTLRSDSGKLGMQYLKKRELTDETMKKWGLGYSPQSSRALVDYLKSKGYSDDLILKSGLAIHKESKGMQDKFWNRVIFPIQNINGKVIGFGGRVMGDGEPKYLNSPETPIFEKRRNLFGLNFAKNSRVGHIILCEGYMDVISMHQAGFTETVASLGTAFTIGQAMLLKRYTDNIILSYDSDGAGTKAAIRAIEILKQAGLSGRVLDLNPYKDPDEFIKNLGADALKVRIDNARNSFYFEIDVIKRGYDLDDPEGKTKFHREIAAKLCEFESDVERDNYLEGVCREYGVSQEGMRGLVTEHISRTGLSKPITKPKSGIHDKKPDSEDSLKVPQRLLITWICEEPSILKTVREYVSPGDFTDELYNGIASKLFEQIGTEGFVPASLISDYEDEEAQKEIAAIFNAKIMGVDGTPLENATIQEKERTLKDLLIKVKQNSFAHYSSNPGHDVNALNEIINSKKTLEKLRKVSIHLE